jgi:hypothetical protein
VITDSFVEVGGARVLESIEDNVVSSLASIRPSM